MIGRHLKNPDYSVDDLPESFMATGTIRNMKMSEGSDVPPGLGFMLWLSQGSAALHPGLFSRVPSGNSMVWGAAIDREIVRADPSTSHPSDKDPSPGTPTSLGMTDLLYEGALDLA